MSPLAVLVGPPGSGKSTVGPLLAGQLGVGFRDTDTDVEAVTGVPIAEFFVDAGEPAFRELERDAVAVALREHDGVLALGGGAVTDAGTRELLDGEAVVFLDVGAATAAERVGLSRTRPLLLGNVRAQLRALLNARAPLYSAVATIRVTTDGRTPDDLATEIADALRAAA